MHEPVYGIDCNNRTFRIRNCVCILGLQSSFVANVFQIGLSQKSGYNRIISDANIFTTIISFAPFIKWLTNLWHCKLPIHIQTHATHRACAQQPNSPQFMFRCFGVRLIACTYYQHEIAMDRKWHNNNNNDHRFIFHLIDALTINSNIWIFDGPNDCCKHFILRLLRLMVRRFYGIHVPNSKYQGMKL